MMKITSLICAPNPQNLNLDWHLLHRNDDVNLGKNASLKDMGLLHEGHNRGIHHLFLIRRKNFNGVPQSNFSLTDEKPCIAADTHRRLKKSLFPSVMLRK
jgi:hypothetical protein